MGNLSNYLNNYTRRDWGFFLALFVSRCTDLYTTWLNLYAFGEFDAGSEGNPFMRGVMNTLGFEGAVIYNLLVIVIAWAILARLKRYWIMSALVFLSVGISISNLIIYLIIT